MRTFIPCKEGEPGYKLVYFVILCQPCTQYSSVLAAYFYTACCSNFSLVYSDVAIVFENLSVAPPHQLSPLIEGQCKSQLYNTELLSHMCTASLLYAGLNMRLCRGENVIVLGDTGIIAMYVRTYNPQRACAARVTVLGLSCLSVCLLPRFLPLRATRRPKSDTNGFSTTLA